MPKLNKILFSSTCALLALTSCAERKVIHNPVPLLAVQQGYNQKEIRQGYVDPIENHGSEWSRYAIRVATGCPMNLNDLSAPTKTIDVPVFEGKGHTFNILDQGQYAIYLSPQIRQDYTEIDHILLKATLAYPTRSSEVIFNKDLTLPPGTGGENLPTYPTWRFRANNVLCTMQVQVLPSAGAISRRIWNDGLGKERNKKGTGGLGNTLPFEKGGTNISDVMHGGNTSRMSHDIDFHDPFNTNMGGYGPLAR